jgi:hypothetical protein
MGVAQPLCQPPTKLFPQPFVQRLVQGFAGRLFPNSAMSNQIMERLQAVVSMTLDVQLTIVGRVQHVTQEIFLDIPSAR